jgi:hypothetical protein
MLLKTRREENTHVLLVEMQTSMAIMGDSMENPPKTRTRSACSLTQRSHQWV